MERLSVNWAHFAMDRSKICRNCLREVWYMTFTRLISVIRKYRMLPRVATGRNSSRAAFIFNSVSPATCSFCRTSCAVDLVMFSTLIRSSSSTSDPWKHQRQLNNGYALGKTNYLMMPASEIFSLQPPHPTFFRT